MSQEVYELLEKGNKVKESRYYYKIAVGHQYYGRQQDWQKALEFMNKALEKNPNSCEALAEKGNLLGYVGLTFCKNKQKEYQQKAFQLYKKALSIDPTYRRAQLYELIEKYYRGKSSFLNSKYQDIDPIMIETKQKMKDAKDKIKEIIDTWLLTWEEDYLDIFLRTKVQVILRRYKEALEIVDKLIIKRPDFIGCYQSKAICYQKLKKLDEQAK